MVLLDNREVKKGWQNLKTEICGFFEKHGADVKSARRWDERRLAYPVQRQLRGTYMLVYFESDTGVLSAIRRDLDYYEPCLRHLTQVCEQVPESAFEPEAEFDESAVRVEDTGTMREQSAEEDEGEEAPEGRRPRREGRGARRDDESSSDEGDAKARGDAKADGDAKAGSDAKPGGDDEQAGGDDEQAGGEEENQQ